MDFVTLSMLMCASAYATCLWMLRVARREWWIAWSWSYRKLEAGWLGCCELTWVLWRNSWAISQAPYHGHFLKSCVLNQQQLGSANPLLLFFLSWSTDPFALLGGLFSWVMSLIIEKSSLAKILLTLVRWSYLAFPKQNNTNKQTKTSGSIGFTVF